MLFEPIYSNVIIDGEAIEQVDNLIYLEVDFHCNGKMNSAVTLLYIHSDCVGKKKNLYHYFLNHMMSRNLVMLDTDERMERKKDYPYVLNDNTIIIPSFKLLRN